MGKYDKASGKRVAGWEGDPKLFPHLNSCAVVKAELVCAASNYPKLPMASSVEIFDAKTLRHIRTVSLGRMVGSLTAMDWHGGSWWAVFANYDDRGGEQIGRASCRERVCQYVVIWVVAVSMKKKQQQ